MSQAVTTSTNDPGLNALALHALAVSRNALPFLRDGNPRAYEQQMAALAESIERRDIFNPGVAADLRDLVGKLEIEVADMLVFETMISDHDCDVTENSWVETIWSPQARDLAEFWGVFKRLSDAIEAVFDRQELDRVLGAARQPSLRH